jgi:hypothetical protein
VIVNLTYAIVYAVVCLVVMPLVFRLFKTRAELPEILIASIAGGAATLIPTWGGVVSLVVTVGVLYWRIRDSLFPDIFLAVAAARLTMVPVLLLIQLRGH